MMEGPEIVYVYTYYLQHCVLRLIGFQSLPDAVRVIDAASIGSNGEACHVTRRKAAV